LQLCAFNYECDLESGLDTIDYFIYSHFIRKTWASDETYAWAPYAMYFFVRFLSIHKIINEEEEEKEESIKILQENEERYYSYYKRNIDPKDKGSVIYDMGFW
jgi:hypothetical protein